MSVPTKPQIRAGNLWNTYVRGWAHGAACKAMGREFTDHSNAEIVTAYNDGYREGRADRNVMAQAAAVRYGYEPSVLRLQDLERCGVEGCRLPPDHKGIHKFGNDVP